MPTYNIQIGVQNEPISQTYIGVGRVDLKFPDDVTQATIGPNTTVELDFSGMSPPFTLERLTQVRSSITYQGSAAGILDVVVPYGFNNNRSYAWDVESRTAGNFWAPAAGAGASNPVQVDGDSVIFIQSNRTTSLFSANYTITEGAGNQSVPGTGSLPFSEIAAAIGAGESRALGTVGKVMGLGLVLVVSALSIIGTV